MKNDMIGIICAMDKEACGIIENMTDVTREEISGVTFNKGKINGKNCVVAVCGIGKVFAALCAQTMILKYAPDLIINSGVAGSLVGELSVCDVALAGAVVQHDMDTSPLGDPVGLISGINVVYIDSAKEYTDRLAAAASENGIKTLVGNIASGDQFIASAEKKAYIRDTFGAIACEMEGAAIGQVCYISDVDFVIIRCISDSATGEAQMEYPEMVSRAAKKSTELVIAMLNDLED